MPLFSVIVPAYKTEEYIEKCVNSILSQSFRDYELIIIDDGSPDKCLEICEAYAKKDRRVKVYHKENGGVSSARNLGIKNASGEWIWFIDSDDYIEPFSLAQLSESVSCKKADLYVFNCKGINDYYSGDLDSFLNKFYFTYIIGFGPCNKLYKREIIQNHNLQFDTEESIGEDLLFNLRYYKALSSGLKDGRYSFIGRDYYHYVNRVGSAMNTKYKERFHQQLRLYDKIRGFLSESVSAETISYLFLLHLISGIHQASHGDFSVYDFNAEMENKRYETEIIVSKTVISKFFRNEHASLGGQVRLRLFLIFLKYGDFIAAGKLMGLRG